MTNESKLIIVKSIHTAVWAVFASSIIAIPIFAYHQKYLLTWSLIAFVFIEVLVLLANQMRCPLTDVASKYTTDRKDNFDIYLPLWVARNNKIIFGTLYMIGIIYVVFVYKLSQTSS